uniref:universal stress protein n=1 Tax=Thaumasiovibrio occultus TaxID=1891184 RepID=UPI000B357C5C|nr:universal stress protein [Thaumasiovibrio occultus]
MSYKHIMVAVDLSADSELLIKKGANLAAALEARLSIIHIDVNYAELYTGLIDINLAATQHKMALDTKAQIDALVAHINYPVYKSLVGAGDLSDEICGTILKEDVDLLVCGHHQDFWSKLLSSTKQLINVTPVDLLMVPLHD